MRNRPVTTAAAIALLLILSAAPAAAARLDEATDAKAIAFISIPSVPALIAPGESAFDRIMSEPEVARFISEGFPALARMRDDFAAATGMSFSEAVSLAIGEAALAVVGDEENMVAVVGAIEVDTGNPRLAELVGKLESLTEWQTIEIPGGRLHSKTLGRIDAVWGMKEGYLVFGTSETAVRDLCGAIPLGRPESLAGSNRYRYCLNMADASQSELTVYVDCEELAGACLRDAPEETRAFFDALGVLSIGSLLYSSRPASDGFIDTFLVYFPSGRDGIFAAPEPSPAGLSEALARIPRDVISASWSHGDLAMVYDVAAEAVRAVVPADILEGLTSRVGALKSEAEVDIRADLFGSLAKNITTWTPKPSQVLGLGFSGGLGQGVMMVELGDEEHFRGAIERTWAYLEAHQAEFAVELDMGPFAGEPIRFLFARQDFVGQTVYQACVSLTPMMQATASLAVADGHVIFSMDAQSIRNVLSAPGADPGLAQNPDYARAAQLAGTADTEVSYIDTKALFENTYGLLAMMLPLMLSQIDADMPLDQLLMPSGPAISRHLFGSATAVTTGDDHVKITSFGPVGQARAAYMGGVGGASIGYWVARSSMDDRALVAAPGGGAQANRNILKQVALGLLMYSNDYSGEFPPDLETISQAGYVKGEVADGLAAYSYVPGLRDDYLPGLIIAYAKETTPAGRLALFIDGHVMNLTDAELAEQVGGWLDLPEEPSDDALRAACGENLRVLAESVRRYARYHDGAVPEKLNLAADYRFAPLVTNCPADAEIGHGDYATVEGLNISALPQGSEGAVLLVYEPAARHDGAHSAVFMDGTRVLLDDEELAAAIAWTIEMSRAGG